MEWVVLFGLGLSTGLSGAMIPGPLMLYTVSEAFRHGQMAGLKIAAGHLLLEAGFVVLVILGLRDLLSSAAFRTSVVWVGAGGLMMMGGLILLTVRRLSLAQTAAVPFQGGPILGGAFFSLTSPGFLLWWATIGTSVVLQGSLAGTPGLTAVAGGHALADLFWCWFVAWSVERGKVYCTDQVYRVIMILIALTLIGLGIGLPLHEHAVR